VEDELTIEGQTPKEKSAHRSSSVQGGVKFDINSPLLSASLLAPLLFFDNLKWQLVKRNVAICLCYLLKEKKIPIPTGEGNVLTVASSNYPSTSSSSPILSSSSSLSSSSPSFCSPSPHFTLLPFYDYGPIFSYIDHQRNALSLKNGELQMTEGRETKKRDRKRK
jgi:hypothetical protein